MHHTWNPVHLSSIETYIPQEVWSPVPKKTLQTLGSTKQAKASCIAGQGSTCWTWRTQKCWRRRSVAGALSCGGPETLQIERISHEDWGEKYTECDRRWQTNDLNKIHVCISMSIYIYVCVCVWCLCSTSFYSARPFCADLTIAATTVNAEESTHNFQPMEQPKVTAKSAKFQTTSAASKFWAMTLELWSCTVWCLLGSIWLTSRSRTT